MHRCYYKNYRFIGVMFWAFPYLLWQTFGHISGFFVGALVAVTLTIMLNSMIRGTGRQPLRASQQQPLLTMTEQQPHQASPYQQPEPYQRGYRAEPEPYRGTQQPYRAEELQPQYEDMLVQYPQEMPPMQQS